MKVSLKIYQQIFALKTVFFFFIKILSACSHVDMLYIILLFVFVSIKNNYYLAVAKLEEEVEIDRIEDWLLQPLSVPLHSSPSWPRVNRPAITKKEVQHALATQKGPSEGHQMIPNKSFCFLKYDVI